ncbi:histidine kinase [Hymenobacter sp. HMF4947]|uniref:histidine kinase n=1 Tax=Hymenobacter ginkgonis TaxID=2682976 RepID=A0A7K1TI76_9BACT|nr:ATP-binding protein [Hymenobacter ginkgonis]MVN77851.1 histidine kinase [Hymenobacter ginkgonis]
MSDSNMIIEGPIAVGLVWLGRRFLDTPTRLPGWDKWLAQIWKPAVVLFAIAIYTGSSIDLLADAFVLAVLWAGVGAGWKLRAYRPAWLIGVGLVPYVLLATVQLLLGIVAPQFLKANSDTLELAIMVAFIWQGIFWLMARNHKKAEVAEQQIRLEAEREKQRIEAQNLDLAQMINQRTAALARQTDELRATLSELQATQGQLIQSEKMASLGELTAGIAHEIQNPLNFVNNFADVSVELVAELEEERARPTRDAELEAELLRDLKQNLQRITQHGGRASGIVRGMLEHSRASTGERRPTDLNALADEYLRLAYHGLRAKDKTFNATLQTDFAPSLPLIEALSQDLGRVLLNLFTNAFYAVQKRQQLGEAGYTPTVSVHTQPLNGGVEVRVGDNGVGIPPDIQARIFEPFFTTKPSGEGTGLGLSLAHDIVVKGHGGTLQVVSAPGQGTEFVLTLPD